MSHGDDPADAGAEPVEGEQATLTDFAASKDPGPDSDPTPEHNAAEIELLAEHVGDVVDQIGTLLDQFERLDHLNRREETSQERTEYESTDPSRMFQ